VSSMIARIAADTWGKFSSGLAERKRRSQKSSRRRLFVEALECRRVMAVARIVEDGVLGGGVNNGDIGSDPSAIVDVNGIVYFSAADGVNGTELWRVLPDGQAQMVEDAIPGGGISSGAFSSSPAYLTNVGGTLYFSADDGVNGIELWRVNSSGSAELVQDNVPGNGISATDSSFPRLLTNVAGTLYFSATDGVNGNELWRVGSNGIAELVDDVNPVVGIRPGVLGSNPSYLTEVSGQLFFVADDGTNGYELWRVPNGGPAFMVGIPGRAGGMAPNDLSAFNNGTTLVNHQGILYFVADDSFTGKELWRVDATNVPQIIDDFNGTGGDGIELGIGGSYPTNLVASNGTLYFQATTSTLGSELWRLNVNTGTAHLVEDIIPGDGLNPGFVGSNPNYLTDVSGTLYFSATTSADGTELWRVFPGGFAEIVAPGGTGGIAPGGNSSDPAYLTNVNGILYFTANLGTAKFLMRIQNQLAAHVEDELPGEGTVLLSDESNAFSMTSHAAKLYFVASNPNVGNELYSVGIDGVARIVEDIPGKGGISSGAQGSSPRALVSVPGALYFTADDGIHGFELWRLGGNPGLGIVNAGPNVVGINQNSADSDPRNFFYANGTAYFSAYDGENGRELWQQTSTGPATLIKNLNGGIGGLNPGSASSSPRDLTAINGAVFFTADTANGVGLWQIVNPNGEAILISETQRQGGVFVGQNSPRSALLTEANGTIYFVAADSAGGNELWKSPLGGATGASRVELPGTIGGINPGSASSDPDKLINVNGTLYFVAQNATAGRELWAVQPGGAVSIVELFGLGEGLYPGTVGSQPVELFNHLGTLYFQANDGSAGRELWRMNGTVPQLVDSVSGAGINPAGFGSYPNSLTNVSGTLYFNATTEAEGKELWKILPAGLAIQVEDSISGGGIAPGTRGSNPRFLTNVSGILYFNATDGDSGYELWRVDGNQIAVMVEDSVPDGGIAPGNLPSGPSQLTNADGSLYFVANNGTDGPELWRIDDTSQAVQVDDTVLGAGIMPGSEGSIVDSSSLVAVGNTLYFTADDGTNGIELWAVFANGFAVLVPGPSGPNQILAGSLGSLPTELTNLNGTLYFSATAGDSFGTEALRVVDNQIPTLSVTNAVVNGSKGTVVNNTGLWNDLDQDAVSLSASLGSVVKDTNGTWTWSLTTNTILTNQLVTISAVDALGGFSTTNFTVNVGAAISNRRVFYNRSTSSVFGNGTGNPLNSIDNSKQALLPGQIASTANYTNYSRGLNGIVIDMDGAANLSAIDAASFQFATWSTFPDATPNFLPITTSVTVSTFANGGINNTDRIKLEFANNVIQEAWLRITVLANASTGLTSNDVFYFGNARFDVTPATPFPASQVVINAFDTNAVRAKLGLNPGVISNVFDVDRSGAVNAFDVNFVRANQGRSSLRGFQAPLNLSMSLQAAPPVVYKNSLKNLQSNLADQALSSMTLN
jgi:ELWxxDGT repeat protein